MKKKKLANEEISKLVNSTLVSPDIQKEYICYHDNFNGDIAFDRSRIVEESKRLVLKKTSLSDKKYILFSLAHTPTLSAHSAITRYLRDADKDLLQWAVLAWQESHELILETGMQKIFGDSFESKPLVMTGLGSDEVGRLRYSFVVSTIGGIPFSKAQEDHLREIIEKTDHNNKTNTESVVVKGSYALITVCIRMDVAPATYIEEAIQHANIADIFLRYHYYAVNTRMLTEEEITNYLAGLDDCLLPDSFL